MESGETILTAADHAFFQEHGYVIARNVVPRENLEAVLAIMFEFLGMDRDNPEDWYREPLRPGGMVELYQHQALWNNRQHPRVYQVFREILGTARLWVSLDRVNFRPPQHPEHPEYDHPGFIHWDVDVTQLPQPFGVQGVLYLTDTTEDMGGFRCIPGGHIGVEEWVRSLPPDVDPRCPPTEGRRVAAIPGNAGDLLIWNRLLPHGNGRNVSDRPRFAQYITMYPAREADEEQRQRRVTLWEQRLCPGGRAFPGDPRRVEELHYQSADLTPLGRLLLGLDHWPRDIG